MSPGFDYDLSMRERTQVFQGCPPIKRGEPERTMTSKARATIRIVNVPNDKKTPGILNGTRTDTLLDGSTVVYTWSLRRCK